MPSPTNIQILRDAAGATVYRVAVGVGGNVSVVRDFKSKEDAERFAALDREALRKRRGGREGR